MAKPSGKKSTKFTSDNKLSAVVNIIKKHIKGRRQEAPKRLKGNSLMCHLDNGESE
jgi:hypothetical protein